MFVRCCFCFSILPRSPHFFFFFFFFCFFLRSYSTAVHVRRLVIKRRNNHHDGIWYPVLVRSVPYVQYCWWCIVRRILCVPHTAVLYVVVAALSTRVRELRHSIRRSISHNNGYFKIKRIKAPFNWHMEYYIIHPSVL